MARVLPFVSALPATRSPGGSASLDAMGITGQQVASRFPGQTRIQYITLFIVYFIVYFSGVSSTSNECADMSDTRPTSCWCADCDQASTSQFADTLFLFLFWQYARMSELVIISVNHLPMTPTGTHSLMSDGLCWYHLASRWDKQRLLN